jgi:hypothetical protein
MNYKIYPFLAVMLVGCVASANAAENESRSLLISTEDSGSKVYIAKNITTAIASDYSLSIDPIRRVDIISTVANDSTKVGLIGYDDYLARLDEDSNLAERIGFYGEVPICLFAVRSKIAAERKRQAVRIIGINSKSVVDVGLGDQETAQMINTLWSNISERDDIVLSNVGGYRAMASVEQGFTDVAYFSAYPHTQLPFLKHVANRNGLNLVESIDEVLGPVRLGRRGAYLPTRLEIEGDGWFKDKQYVNTLCTSMGVVVNTEASGQDRMFVEEIVRVMMTADLNKDASAGVWQQMVGYVQTVYTKVVDSVKRIL